MWRSLLLFQAKNTRQQQPRWLVSSTKRFATNLSRGCSRPVGTNSYSDRLRVTLVPSARSIRSSSCARGVVRASWCDFPVNNEALELEQIVEEILACQDELGKKRIRKLWTREYLRRCESSGQESSCDDKTTGKLELDRDGIVGGRNDDESGQPSIAPGLALLRCMTEDDWRDYDDLELIDNVIKGAMPACDELSEQDDEEDLTLSDFIPQVHSDKDFHSVQDAVDSDRGTLPLTPNRSTEEYNATLIRLALSSELEPDEIFIGSMVLLERMHELARVGLAAPNAVTYEIILLALSSRLHLYRTAAAVDLVSQMTVQTQLSLTPDTVFAALNILKRSKQLDLSMTILRKFVNDESRNKEIPHFLLHMVLTMAKDRDAKQEALEIIQICLRVRTCDSFQFA
jgi:hypothetical protein